MQSSSLVVRQADLDDLFDAVLAKLDRNADEEIRNAIFTFKEDGTWEDLFLVLEDRFCHFNRSERRSIICRAGFEQADDLGAAVGGAGDDGV